MSKKNRIKPPPMKCCSDSRKADTGSFSTGHHNHGQSRDNTHHATGTKFRPDPSTTKAVLRRMEGLGVV